MKLFEIYECGDPYSSVWDCCEYEKSFDDRFCIYRGDISGLYDKEELIHYLKRQYTGCQIKERYGDSEVL